MQVYDPIKLCNKLQTILRKNETLIERNAI